MQFRDNCPQPMGVFAWIARAILDKSCRISSSSSRTGGGRAPTRRRDGSVDIFGHASLAGLTELLN